MMFTRALLLYYGAFIHVCTASGRGSQDQPDDQLVLPPDDILAFLAEKFNEFAESDPDSYDVRMMDVPALANYFRACHPDWEESRAISCGRSLISEYGDRDLLDLDGFVRSYSYSYADNNTEPRGDELVLQELVQLGFEPSADDGNVSINLRRNGSINLQADADDDLSGLADEQKSVDGSINLRRNGNINLQADADDDLADTPPARKCKCLWSCWIPFVGRREGCKCEVHHQAEGPTSAASATVAALNPDSKPAGKGVIAGLGLAAAAAIGYYFLPSQTAPVVPPKPTPAPEAAAMGGSSGSYLTALACLGGGACYFRDSIKSLWNRSTGSNTEQRVPNNAPKPTPAFKPRADLDSPQVVTRATPRVAPATKPNKPKSKMGAGMIVLIVVLSLAAAAGLAYLAFYLCRSDPSELDAEDPDLGKL